MAEVARLDQLPAAERLDPARLMRDLQSQGKPAAYLPTPEAIVDYLAPLVQPDDVVCIFSNGGFGGIHGKLLNRFDQ